MVELPMVSQGELRELIDRNLAARQGDDGREA
jgi:hypothetical protein